VSGAGPRGRISRGLFALGLPVGTLVYLQAWIHDPAGPKGWTMTAGLVASQNLP
jgi:hypothetical protein